MGNHLQYNYELMRQISKYLLGLRKKWSLIYTQFKWHWEKLIARKTNGRWECVVLADPLL